MNKFLPRKYPQAWTEFRKFSREGDILLKTIGQAISSLDFDDDWQLIDAGTGDGGLLKRILDARIFFRKPAHVTVVEPCSELMHKAKTNLSQHSSSTEFDFIGGPLATITAADIRCRQGLVLAIHSSYYFTQSDLNKLSELRRRNFRVLVIENDLDCWVSKEMADIGNFDHPQFDDDRFSRMLLSLGTRRDQVEVRRFHAALGRPRFWQVLALLGFFTFLQNTPGSESPTLSSRMSAKILKENLRDAEFVYRCIKAGW